MRWADELKRRLPAEPAPVILMYHRIAPPDRDPWGLAVSPANFADQLKALRRHHEVLPLGEFARRHRNHSLPSKAIAITFDDGYACNALTAAPLLASHKLHATFFLTTGMIGKEYEFWTDELERVVFDPAAGGVADLRPADRTIRVDLGQDTDTPQMDRAWVEFRKPRTFRRAVREEAVRRLRKLSGSETPTRRSQRQQAYLALWTALKPLAPDDQREAIADLASQVGSTAPPRDSHRPMTESEAKSIAALECAEIGGHTVNHRSLPIWDRASQLREISDSLDACEAISGRAATTFAYPYGDHSQVTLEIAAGRSIDVGCSTVAKPVRPGADPLALPRMQALDWSGDQLVAMIRSHARKR